MADEHTYNTPEKMRADDRRRARVKPVLAQAIADTRMLFVAMQLDAEPDVYDLWSERIKRGLCRLTPEDRITAIIMLIEGHAEHQAMHMVTVDEPHEAMPGAGGTVGRTVARRRRWWPFGGAR